MKEGDSADSPLRRRVFRALTFVPLSAIGLVACSKEEAAGPTRPGLQPKEYQPTFFNAIEWKFLHAACGRLLPQDDIGPGAPQAGVPEFIARHMQPPHAPGDLWYMQDPFMRAAPQF